MLSIQGSSFGSQLSLTNEDSLLLLDLDMRRTVCFVFVVALLFLPACDRLADMLEMPNPGKEAAEAQAIGSACRQTGRSIEDCYALNPGAPKSAVFLGWKAMNEYMMEHNLKDVPSLVPRTEAPVRQSSHEPDRSDTAHVPQPNSPQP